MKADNISSRRFVQRLRHFIQNSSAPSRWLLAVAVTIAGALSTHVQAQGLSPYAFGINYTQSGLSAGKTADLKKARMNIIRLGGNARNNEAYWRDKYDWVNDIEYV